MIEKYLKLRVGEEQLGLFIAFRFATVYFALEELHSKGFHHINCLNDSVMQKR